MKIKLSARLQCVADYVLPGSVAIDVGTDHAYIPIWLLQNGISPRAYASDNKPGPLQNAARDAALAGVTEGLTLYLCDGVNACAPDSVDTVIAAGMGGETILGILEAAPWTLRKHLILQPQTKLRELRTWLSKHGCRVRDARLVDDTGRIYVIWLVGPGVCDDADAPLDRVLVEKRDPLLGAYTRELAKRLRTQISGMERAKNSDSAALASLRRELAELEILHREALQWQQ